MSFAPPRLRPLFEQAMRSRQAGLEAEASVLCTRILQAPPTSADDLYLQGNLLMQMGRIADAAQRFESAVRLGPITVELLVDRGVALAGLGRLEEAVASCAQALTFSPDFAHAWFIHGDCLRQMGRFEEALESFGKALALNPEFIAVLVNRAVTLTGMRRFEDALADYDRLLRLRPDDPESLSSRGHVLGELFRFDEALEDFERVLAANPRHLKALSDRGVVLWNLERFEESLASYDRALALNPDLAPILSNRANALQDLLRLDEAMAAHDRVTTLHPDFASGHWNRSQGLLLLGNWRDGLREFEWRKQRPESAGLYFDDARREWHGGQDLSGKSLLVYAEQGLGDCLQFCRYLAMAQAKGAKVAFAVDDALLRLMQSLEPPVELIPYAARNAAAASFDYHAAMMSLPLAFGSTPDSLPAAVPYLRAEPERAREWGARVGAEGFKIGISWRGGGVGREDTGRAFAPGHLEALSKLPGVRLISLQKGAGAQAQLAALPSGMGVETLKDFDEGPDAFIDTAAVMENLDLVISSDTAVAHLAGALGRPTWLAVKRVPDWRWGLEGTSTPWYPTMRLFRQQAPGQWDSVFAAMQAELAKRLAN